jgi:flagellar protein FlgJ
VVNAVTVKTPVAAQAGARNDKLRETAQQFEAIFVEMLLKQMRSANDALGGEENSFARSTYQGWQDEQMASSIAKGGSFGLANILYSQLQQQAAVGK